MLAVLLDSTANHIILVSIYHQHQFNMNKMFPKLTALAIPCTIPNFRYHTPFLIHSTLGTLSMNKFKLALLTATF